MNLAEIHDQKVWHRIVVAVTAEYAALPATERAWLLPRIEKVERLQARLHGFFEKADGARLCRACEGKCCARGKHHLTLVNLLLALREGHRPPEPDFASTCPFLGPAGCLLDISCRPFNCLSFLCEQVEDRLEPADLAAFYSLERQLRACYEEFEGRYAGAGMSGLMLRADRLGDESFLAPPLRTAPR